jgi:hypothetical protein
MLALAVSARVLVRAHVHGSWLLGFLGAGLFAFASWRLVDLALGRLRELQSALRVRRALSAGSKGRPPQRRAQPSRALVTTKTVLPEHPRDSGVYFTPYPFSVWTFHDQAHVREVDPGHEGERVQCVPAWLWTGVVLGIVLVAMVWLGISVVQLWTAMA